VDAEATPTNPEFADVLRSILKIPPGPDHVKTITDDEVAWIDWMTGAARPCAASLREASSVSDVALHAPSAPAQRRYAVAK
jgi:hypothetical protein